MADKKISDGTTRTLAATDVFEVENTGQAVQYKTALSDIAAALESGGVAELAISASQVATDFSQASHGFTPGDAISHNGSAWVKADANASLPCHALVVAVADANTFSAAVAGVYTLAAHGFTVGQNYLSAVAGDLTNIQLGPGNINQRVLVALDANTVLIAIGEPLT